MPQQFEFPGRRTPSQLRFSPKILYLVLGVLAVLWLASGIYTVQQYERAVILRFGKYSKEVGSGWHYHLPAPIEMRIVRSVTEVYKSEVGFRSVPRHRKDPNESLMLTGDENIVDVELVVQYKVDLEYVRQALFNVRDLGVFDQRDEGLVHDASEAALRQVIGRHSIDEVLTEGKQEIEIEIKKKLQEIFDRYDCGLTVEEVNLQAVSVPLQVDAAFKDVTSAKEDRNRLENEAQGYQNDVIPKARGEAQKMLKEAEAYKVERIRRAQGDADRFQAVFSEYQKAPKVTETRLYIETMEKILPRFQKYIVESDGKGSLLNILNLDKKDGEK